MTNKIENATKYSALYVYETNTECTYLIKLSDWMVCGTKSPEALRRPSVLLVLAYFPLSPTHQLISPQPPSWPTSPNTLAGRSPHPCGAKAHLDPTQFVSEQRSKKSAGQPPMSNC